MIKKIMKHLVLAVIPNKFLRYKESADEKVIYLTFDDGPVEGVTDKLLTLLDKFNAKATFFIIGELAASNRELLIRASQAGHVIANHSYHHKKFSTLSLAKQEEEILVTKELIESTVNLQNDIFRPPGGIWSLPLLGKIFKHKLALINWSLDSLDCRLETSQQITEHLSAVKITSGEVILFHDDDEKVIDVLEKMIPEWQQQGYSFRALTR